MNVLKGVGRGQLDKNVIKEMLEVKDPKFKFYHSLEDPENLLFYNCEFDKKDADFVYCEENFFSL